MKLGRIAAAVALLASHLASAQTISIPDAYRLSAGPRVAAMGSVAIAGRDDDVLFHSPSQLTIARGTSVAGVRLSDAVFGGTISTVSRLGTGGVAVGVRYLEHRDDARARLSTGQNVRFPEGESILAVVGLAQTRGRYRLGATAGYATDRVGFRHTAAFVGQVGIARELNRYFTAAIAGRNLGPSVRVRGERRPLPSEVALGASGVGPVGPLDVTLTGEVAHRRDDFIAAALGVETEWSWLSGYAIAARAGVRRHQFGEPGESAGLGFTADRLSIDYAAQRGADGRAIHHFGLRLR